MTIKTSPQLWGEDARIFTEEADRNGKLPTPKLSKSQRKVLSPYCTVPRILYSLPAKADNDRIYFRR